MEGILRSSAMTAGKNFVLREVGRAIRSPGERPSFAKATKGILRSSVMSAGKNFVLREIGRAIRSPGAKDGGEGGIDSVPSGLCPKACGFAPMPPLLPPGVNLLRSALTPFGFAKWRRGRDSNPRDLAAHRISSAARSTTLPPLRDHTLFVLPVPGGGEL